MCKIAFVGESRMEIRNRAELDKAIGGAPLYKGISTPRPYDCLCDMDALRTAEHYGLELLSKPDDYIIRFSAPKKSN